MDKEAIKSYLQGLSTSERLAFIEELQAIDRTPGIAVSSQMLRREILDNKQGCCAHCGHTNSHLSYKGFATDHHLEHHPLRSDLKQRVKHGVYHIQHVNSTHNRLKKWIDSKFFGGVQIPTAIPQLV